MNRELIDRVWKILPKEFKEEVKYYYQHTDCGTYAEDMLESIFGKHNLTSDAEGEEMLTVSRKRVQEIYSYNEEILSQDPTHGGAILLKKKLTDLFGSKCLPDEEPKQTEPKFRKDEKVRIKGVAGFDVIESIYGTDKEGYRYKLVDETAFYDESDLEPYTEPKEKNHIAQDLEMVDNIIKDGFSKEHRLNIAAMALQGLLSNTALYEHKVKEWLRCESNDNPIKFIPMLALKYADSLIAEAKKGGPDE